MTLAMTDVPALVGHDTRCGAERNPDHPCQRPAGWGTPHPGIGRCKLHGGSTPTHVKAAEQAQLVSIADTYAVPRHVDPAEGLLEELHRTAGMITFYELQTVEADKISESTMFGEQATLAVKLCMKEREHFAKLAADCVRLGLEERRVRAVERDAQQFAQAIRGILSDLGVADDPRAPEIVRRHLALAAA